MRPQAERVMDYMKHNGSITSLQAINDLGITRLSSVIFDMKAEGWDILDRFITVQNRYGEDCRVKQYWCVGKKKTWWGVLKNYMKGLKNV